MVPSSRHVYRAAAFLLGLGHFWLQEIYVCAVSGSMWYVDDSPHLPMAIVLVIGTGKAGENGQSSLYHSIGRYTRGGSDCRLSSWVTGMSGSLSTGSPAGRLKVLF